MLKTIITYRFYKVDTRKIILVPLKEKTADAVRRAYARELLALPKNLLKPLPTIRAKK